MQKIHTILSLWKLPKKKEKFYNQRLYKMINNHSPKDEHSKKMKNCYTMECCFITPPMERK